MKTEPKLKRGFDYIGITCVFFCHDDQGKLLLHKRSKNCKDEIGNWDTGGGALEFGEEFEEALRREVKEEYCADVIDLKYYGAHNVIREHQGLKTHWIALIYLAQVDPKQAKIGEPEKMDDIGWFSIDNLPKPIHSQMDRFVKLIKNDL